MRQLDERGPLSGKRVLDDRYELIELVGTGGMAEVWKAHDRRLGRDVAVKLLTGAAANDESRRRRIEREAKALAATTHPNIVAVYDYGEEQADDGQCHPYIAMELVDGPDLGRYVAEHGPLPVDEAREIMSGVLAAVERAHASGVVHGDLKPGNVFIGSDGPKVGDFGVARILGQETGTTTVAATPTFAAPEVLRGERASPASDVYSAACLTYELLAGRAPYQGASGWEVAKKHLESTAPHVRRVRPDVPADIDAAIYRGMEKLERKRFASAAEFGAAIGTVVPPVAAAAVEPPPADDRTVPVTAVPAGRRDATEVISGPRPDPARAAVFGPFAGIASWWTSRTSRKHTGERSAVGRWSPLIAGLVAVVLVLLLGSVLLRDKGPTPVAVPDVTGKKLVDARKALRDAGLTVDVSYRPVTTGEAGRVLETIPAPAKLVDPKSKVHVIASAFATTPEPVVTQAPSDDERRGGRKRRRNNDD